MVTCDRVAAWNREGSSVPVAGFRAEKTSLLGSGSAAFPAMIDRPIGMSRTVAGSGSAARPAAVVTFASPFAFSAFVSSPIGSPVP